MKLPVSITAGALVVGIISCATPNHCTSSTSIPDAPAIRTANRPVLDLASRVRPLCGSDGDANTFPGAVAPFGMIQWSPDTGAGMRAGGYSALDSCISGFSLDHLSGAGCGYGGNFGWMPLEEELAASPNTNRMAFAARFSHDAETARPGYYSVKLDNGIRVELTTTLRSGFGRFTYPAGRPAALVINAASSANPVKKCGIQINPDRREITGWATGGHFCGGPDETTVYFCAIFNQPFKTYGVWTGNQFIRESSTGTGRAAGTYLRFDLSGSERTVLAKVALSYVSSANARTNLLAESPLSEFKDFDRAVCQAGEVWNSWLNRIQVSGGTEADLTTFYSMLYHVLMAPTVCSDANGEYRGYDGRVHTANGYVQYANFSGWDVYRSECQLLAMIAPQQAGDMAQSLLVNYQQGGAFPRWGVPNEDSGIMMGDPAAPMIAGFYAFGATNFDARAALAGLARAATDPSVRAHRTGIRERDALQDYLELGYVPEYQHGGYGNVSMTLEYASADFALAEFARALGDEAIYASAMQRAQNWRNLFNPATGCIQMRRAWGLWAPGFTNNVPDYNRELAYVEGSAEQYVWMVPFNLRSLFQMMGGPEAAAKRLDTFFTKLNFKNMRDGWYSEYAYLGNEVCLEVPWEYCFLGQPYKTQKIVRQAITELYSSANDGYPGNDDLGEMSSWYVFGALGFYPELPGSDVLVLGSPLFPKAVLHLREGDVTITGQGAERNAPYVQSLAVNGRPWNKPWLRFSDIRRGGELAFRLDSKPNMEWGTNSEAAPPSYTAGMEKPVAPAMVWGTGFEWKEPSLTWSNTPDGSPEAGGITNVGGVLDASAAPELDVRHEAAQTGGGALMFSGKAAGGATTHAYFKAFDLSSQNLIVKPGMRLSYWIYPQGSGSHNISGDNSAFVAMDLLFDDGASLRDSNVVDQHGVRLHPYSQGRGSRLRLNNWNYITADLTALAGKKINRIDLGYDRPGSTGGFRGYVDDIEISIP